MEQQELKLEEQEEPKDKGPLLAIKYLKLKTGDDLVAMVEFGNGEQDGLIILYNPFKLFHGDFLGGLGGSGNSFKKVAMEEWLPYQIVQEQVCTIYAEDVLTITPVNKEFSVSYSKAIVKKVQLQELLRTGSLVQGNQSVPREEDMSEEELDEESQKEFEELLDKKLLKLRRGYN